jgi:hypothetical protein
MDHDVTVNVNCMSVVFIILPHIRQHNVHSFSIISLKDILSQDPVVQIIGISQVFGVLVNSSAIFREPCPEKKIHFISKINSKLTLNTC